MIDEVSAHLLSGRFTQERRASPPGILLLSEVEHAAPLRPLLSQPTPSVGREVELNFLQSQLLSCVEDSKACAILVTSVPGLGKSRLRHEFLQRTEQLCPALSVFSAQGALRDGAVPYSLVARLLRSALSPQTATQLDDSQSSPLTLLRARLARWLPATEREVVPSFLLQAVAPSDEPNDPTAHAAVQDARKDGRRMHDHIRRAFLCWLAAECAHAPVLLALDDLHWSDPLSVGLIDDALRELRRAPLFVLALAGPEIRKAFPKLWFGQPLQELPLKPLSRRACERMIRHVLGSQISAEQTTRMIEQSTGNPLFLEELLYAHQVGDEEVARQTLVALLQARIGRLDAGPRRLLLAASIFGLHLQRSGLLALLGIRPGEAAATEALDQDLNTLVQAELIEPLPARLAPSDSATPDVPSDDRFYAFRSPLLQPAAYELLSVNALLVGHRLAGRYLERLGHADPLHLAEHFQRGREPEKAALFFLRAAVQTSRHSLPGSADSLLNQAHEQLASLPDSPSRQRLLIDILLHRVRFGMGSLRQEENLARLDEAQILLMGLEDREERDSGDELRRAWIEQLSGRICLLEGRVADAMLYCRRVLPVAESLADASLLATASHLLGFALVMQGRFVEAQPHLCRSLAMLPHLDHDLQRLTTQSVAALCQMVQGDCQAGLALHSELITQLERSGQLALAPLTEVLHAIALALSGDVAATLRHAQQVLPQIEGMGSPVLRFPLHSLIAWSHALLGDAAQARASQAMAQTAAQISSAHMLFGDWLDAVHADILLRCGQPDQALRCIERAQPRWRTAAACLGPQRTELGSAAQPDGPAAGRGSRCPL
jgi:tetratricopeptide (TPR) repeat protein